MLGLRSHSFRFFVFMAALAAPIGLIAQYNPNQTNPKSTPPPKPAPTYTPPPQRSQPAPAPRPSYTPPPQRSEPAPAHVRPTRLLQLPAVRLAPSPLPLRGKPVAMEAAQPTTPPPIRPDRALPRPLLPGPADSLRITAQPRTPLGPRPRTRPMPVQPRPQPHPGRQAQPVPTVQLHTRRVPQPPIRQARVRLPLQSPVVRPAA
jgi:hypothetical protein